MFVHTNVKKTGDVKFNESLAVLNGIQRAYVYTQLSNMHSHPTDCPTREKRGWTGDSQLTSGGAALNFDALGFYGNWLQVMADHQAVNCALHTAAPTFPQANKDVCCDPPNNGFGCDYTGLAGGRFNDTHGALADVIPFTHVGGWPVELKLYKIKMARHLDSRCVLILAPWCWGQNMSRIQHEEVLTPSKFIMILFQARFPFLDDTNTMPL